MRTRRRQRSTHQRGAALVELALVVPIFVVLLLFASFFTDVIRVKLKLQEASRYAAWELTSHPLGDWANENHDAVFEAARKSVAEEARLRFQDLDSADRREIGSDSFPFSFALEARSPTFEIVNQEVPLLPEGVPGLPDLGGLGGAGNSVLGAVGFDTRGQIEVTVRGGMKSLIVPKSFMQRSEGSFQGQSVWGAADLSKLETQNRYTLIASSWFMPDGADQTVRGDQSGVHRDGAEGGIRRQVTRMKFAGAGGLIEDNGVLDALSSFAGKVLPTPTGTFVVSHNYATEGAPSYLNRICNTPGHVAPAGMRNLDVNDGLDQKDGDNNDFLRCFDTAPFRDTQAYGDSLYAKIFEARGQNFMGCPNAQADDPTYDSSDPDPRPSATSGDRNKQPVHCR